MEKKEPQAAEKARTEERYRAIFESANDGIIILDAKGCITEINRRAEQMSGYTKEDFLGRNIAEIDILTPKSKEEILENFSRRMRGMSVSPYEIEIIASDGTMLFAEINATPLREKGKVTGEIVILRDITERKRAEEALRESQEHAQFLADVLERSSQPFAVGYPDGRLMTYNTAYCKLLGYSKEELHKLQWITDLTPPEWREVVAKAAEEIGRTGQPQRFEKEYIRKDGSRVPVEVFAHPIFDGKGNLQYFYSFFTDITERKQMEQQLRRYSEQLEQRVRERTAELEQSKAYIESMFNAIADPIFVIRPDRTIIAVNKAVTELLGYQEDELIGNSYIDTITPPERRHLSGMITDEVIAEGVTLTYEKIWQTKDGVEIPMALHTAPLRDSKGDIIGIIVVARDMREIKSLIDELEQSKAFIESMLNGLADAVIVIDRKGIIVAVNRAATEVLGYHEDELLGHYATMLRVPRQRSLGTAFKEVIAKGIAVQYERTWQTRDGVEIPMLVHSAPFRDKQGAIIGVIGVARDIRRIKSLTDELARSEERYRALFEHAPVAIVVADSSNTIQLWNEQAEKQTGYKAEEIIGKSPRAAIPDDLLAEAKWLMEQLKEKGYVEGYETERVTKHGVRYPVELTMAALRDDEGNFIGSMFIVTDISERKRLERERAEAQERLLWAERLAAIGQVASGMAHELRQPLSVLNNAAYFLKMKLGADDEKVKRHLDILEKEVGACESIISDVLDFVRPKKPVRKQVDINLVIEEALSQATLPPGIAVVTEFKELPPLTGDPNQLERVFTNIILNAAQAMPDGGRLVIRTERDNNLIRAEIEDSGSGIPEEDLGRVFEPLFTRKGGGTGLGLSLAKSIIEAHHGAIDIESEVDHGTKVAVELPIKERR